MITVLWWELRRRLMFTLWWSIGVSLLIAVTVLAFIAIKSQAAELNQSFASLSASAGSFFGGSDLFSPIGYLSSQIYYIVLPIVLIILGVTLSSSLMNRDEADATVELTLARPVSRSGVLFGKALAGLIIVCAVMVVTYFVTIICVRIAGIDINQKNLLLTHLLCFAFATSFGTMSFALTAFSRLTQKVAAVVAIVLSFGGYIISSLSEFEKALKPLAQGLPYHYYHTVDLLSGTVSRGLIAYLILVYVLSVLVMWQGYIRRDIG